MKQSNVGESKPNCSDTKAASDRSDILLKRMDNLKKDKNIVSFTQEKFFKTYRKKIAVS